MSKDELIRQLYIALSDAREVIKCAGDAAGGDDSLFLTLKGRAFVYTDRESGRVTTILGYPTAKIAQLG
jgi:hypothetical protein